MGETREMFDRPAGLPVRRFAPLWFFAPSNAEEMTHRTRKDAEDYHAMNESDEERSLIVEYIAIPLDPSTGMVDEKTVIAVWQEVSRAGAMPRSIVREVLAALVSGAAGGETKP